MDDDLLLHEPDEFRQCDACGQWFETPVEDGCMEWTRCYDCHMDHLDKFPETGEDEVFYGPFVVFATMVVLVCWVVSLLKEMM